MRVEVQFINFPKSKQTRMLVEQKIVECIEKFISNNVFVKVFFKLDGFEHHAKISVTSGKINACVNANAIDIAHCIDRILNKLESSLRRVSKKRIHKRIEFSSVSNLSDYNVTNLRNHKRIARKNEENIFDKYESHYISNFEDRIRKVS